MTHLSTALVCCKQEKNRVDRLDLSRGVSSLFLLFRDTPIGRVARKRKLKLISVHKRLSKIIHVCETIALHWSALRTVYEDISPNENVCCSEEEYLDMDDATLF